MGKLKIAVRNFLFLVSNFFPLFFFIFLYSIWAKFALIYLGRKRKYSVWTRNSVRSGRIMPFLSDIDLTVLSREEFSAADCKHLMNDYKRIKFFIPLLGEVNSYSPSSAEIVSKTMNPFELRRDPDFIRLFGARPATRWDEVVFIVRHIESDRFHLRSNPKIRLRKWKGHFADLNWDWTDQDEESFIGDGLTFLLSRIFQRLGMDIHSSSMAIKSINELLFKYKDEKSFDAIWSELPKNPWWFSFFPHRFCHAKDDFHPVLDKMGVEIFTAGALWEAGGLLSQICSLRDTGVVAKHLQRLETLLRRMEKHEAANQLNLAVGYLISSRD